MKLVTKILAAAAGLMVGAMSHAALVTQWSAVTTGSWSNQEPGSVLISGDTLSWGDPGGAPRSSLVITNPGPTDVNTYVGVGNLVDFLAPSLTLTHNNEPIPASTDSLTSVILNVSLKVTPTSPVAPQLDLGVFEYHIQFVETSNSGAPGECEDPGSPSACNDIFVLLAGDLNQSFNYEGFKYFVNALPLEEDALSVLPTGACIAAGAAEGCRGFSTVEGLSNDLKFGLTISAQPLFVPEPAGLAVLGLALAGAGLARRRVTQAA